MTRRRSSSSISSTSSSLISLGDADASSPLTAADDLAVIVAEEALELEKRDEESRARVGLDESATSTSSSGRNGTVSTSGTTTTGSIASTSASQQSTMVNEDEEGVDDEEYDDEAEEEEEEEEGGDDEEGDDDDDDDDEEDVDDEDDEDEEDGGGVDDAEDGDADSERVYRIVEDVALQASAQPDAVDVRDMLYLPGDSGQHNMQEEATDERVAAFTMTVMLALLLLTIMMGVMLKHFKSKWVHQSGAALMLGVALGCFVYLTLESSYDSMPDDMRYTMKAFAQCMKFDTKFFFLVLLPPLIFEAGYTLHPSTFFQNSDAIATFAFCGALTSAISIGLLMYGFGALGVSYAFSLKSCMLFGALISSTDPVTTLSIFSESPVSEDLHAIILGESVLNDAVTIVFFESLLLGIGNAAGDITALDVLQSDDAFLPLILQTVGIFVLAFGQATLIGIITGCVSALLHKHVNATNYFHEGWVVDSTIVLLFPYISYSLAEAFELSGIVSVLFTGIVMGRYTRPNLSRAPRMVTMCLFRIFSFLSETFVFLYMGSAMYTFRTAHIVTCLVGLFVTYIGRAVNIFPGSALLNLTAWRKHPHTRITKQNQFVLWFCGLRGAVAFALAVKAQRDLGEQGHVMFDVTLFIVAVTLVLQGGMTNWLLSLVNATGPNEADSPSSGGASSPDSKSNLMKFMSRVNQKVIEPFLLAKSVDESSHLASETTALLGDRASVDRASAKLNDSERAQEEQEPPSSASARGGVFASDSVEAAVDDTFTPRDFAS